MVHAPLAKSFAWNSAYAFAENRVIDGHDLEGKEWERKINYDIWSGQFQVTLNVKVQVVNASKIISGIEADGFMSAMQNQVSTTFTQTDKDRGISYSTVLEYENYDRNNTSIVSIEYNKPLPFLMKLFDATSSPEGFITVGTTLARPVGTTTDKYRYGFNGKESDNEAKGAGNSIDFGYRIYDSRLGRFLSNDPLFREYPNFCPYQYNSNSPIFILDVDGLGDPLTVMKVRRNRASNLQGNVRNGGTGSVPFITFWSVNFV